MTVTFSGWHGVVKRTPEGRNTFQIFAEVAYDKV